MCSSPRRTRSIRIGLVKGDMAERYGGDVADAVDDDEDGDDNGDDDACSRQYGKVVAESREQDVEA